MTPTHKTGPLAEHPLRAPVLWGAAWVSARPRRRFSDTTVGCAMAIGVRAHPSR